MTEVTTYLKQAVEQGASDLFLAAGGPVSIKLGGHLRPLDDRRLLPPRHAGADFPALRIGRPLHGSLPGAGR